MFINVYDNGRVNRPGTETPAATSVHKVNKDTLVLKVPGHTYWTGLYQKRGYAPAEYIIYDIKSSTRYEFRTAYDVSERVRFPVR